MPPTTAYVGRFAPSPTGPLHFGSLVAAVGSYLDARAQGGRWLLRIEDIDRERCRPEWTEDILRTLEGFGFEWDGEVMRQSSRDAAYAQALDALAAAGHVYPCGCTRREVADSSVLGIEGPVYPGTCRNGLAPGRPPRAIRLRVPETPIEFEDAIQGPICQRLASDVGDFILRRADGPFAYQLAVVVDDAAQGVTHVVRGADLLDSTPRQIWLQRLLGLPQPVYKHLPVALNAAGEKLSKQTLAGAVGVDNVLDWLDRALRFLGQPAPPTSSTLNEHWAWATEHWSVQRVPRQRGIVADCRDANASRRAR